MSVKIKKLITVFVIILMLFLGIFLSMTSQPSKAEQCTITASFQDDNIDIDQKLPLLKHVIAVVSEFQKDNEVIIIPMFFVDDKQDVLAINLSSPCGDINTLFSKLQASIGYDNMVEVMQNIEFSKQTTAELLDDNSLYVFNNLLNMKTVERCKINDSYVYEETIDPTNLPNDVFTQSYFNFVNGHISLPFIGLNYSVGTRDLELQYDSYLPCAGSEVFFELLVRNIIPTGWRQINREVTPIDMLIIEKIELKDINMGIQQYSRNGD